MTATVIIPARFGSTRFPAKILASDTGKPLVQHVVEQVNRCQRVSDVIVATDDARIVEALAPFGTRVVMTSAEHVSGTDRIAEVAERIDSPIIINVQGDEPEIEPATIDQLIGAIAASDHQMATVVTPFPQEADPANPNLVKVALSEDRRAVYFSRALIPHFRDGTSGIDDAYHLHLGIYAYKREFLLEYAKWKPTPLEQAEKLEQLRALEHGVSIAVVKVRRAAHGIDTREQYDAFVRRYRNQEDSRQQVSGSRR